MNHLTAEDEIQILKGKVAVLETKLALLMDRYERLNTAMRTTQPDRRNK